MKDIWKRRNKKSKTAYCYHEGTCHLMENLCKRKIKEGKSHNYQIEFYKDGKIMDTINLDDCFNVDNISSNHI